VGRIRSNGKPEPSRHSAVGRLGSAPLDDHGVRQRDGLPSTTRGARSGGRWRRRGRNRRRS
jgi:hypothetical protein